MTGPNLHVVRLGRVAVAVTAGLGIVVAVPDGQAAVDPEHLVEAIRECQQHAAAARAAGIRPVPDCPVPAGEAAGVRFPCTTGHPPFSPDGHAYQAGQGWPPERITK